MKEEVATFRTGRFQVSMPAAVIVALATAAGAWIAKPSQAVALSQDDREALQACRDMSKKIDTIERKQENFQNWIEPQIGVILVQLNARGYAPAAPAPR